MNVNNSQHVRSIRLIVPVAKRFRDVFRRMESSYTQVRHSSHRANERGGLQRRCDLQRLTRVNSQCETSGSDIIVRLANTTVSTHNAERVEAISPSGWQILPRRDIGYQNLLRPRGRGKLLSTPTSLP